MIPKMKKYTIEVKITLELQVIDELPRLAADTATELVRTELKKTELGKALYCSIQSEHKCKRSEDD